MLIEAIGQLVLGIAVLTGSLLLLCSALREMSRGGRQ